MAHAQGPSQQKPPIRTADPVVEDGSVSIDGRPLAFRRAGTGPALLLLHAASPAADAAWETLLKRLAKRHTVVGVTTQALAAAAGASAEGSATGMARTVVALARALQIERPFLVGSGTGAVVAYAVGRSEPAALRGLVLLDTLVPGIAPWKGEGPGAAAWSVDASLNAAHNAPSELPLVLVLGQKSPHAAQIANHAVALREHGWRRIDTALVRMAGAEVVVDQVGPVGSLIERHAR
jgi:pimeloyl-ACP methyl ester carboxylesterase